MPFSRISLVVWAIGAFCGYGITPARAGEEEGGAKAEGPAEPKEQREYTEKRNRVTALAGKIEESEKAYQALVEEEGATIDTGTKRGIIREMIKISDQKAKDLEQYRALKSELTLRYPGEGEPPRPRGEAAEGEKKKTSVESIASEAAQSLDEVLTQTKKLIDQKFAPFAPPEAIHQKRAPASADTASERPRLRLEK